MIQQSYTRRVSPMHPRLLLQRVKLAWPFAVWLAVAVLCAVLYFGYGQFSGFAGVVVAPVESVAPLRTARLIGVEVVPGQQVQPGDLLARMDADLVHAEIAVLEARIAEEESALADFEREILAAVARLDTDVSVAEARLAEVRLLQAQRDAEARELRVELSRREALLSRQLTEAAEVHEVRLRLVAVQAMQDGFPALDRLYAERLQAARSLRQDLQGAMNIEHGQGAQEALARKADARRHVLAAERERLLRELSLYELRATSAGIVAEVYQNPGAIVPSGEVILRLVPASPAAVEAFLPASMLGAVREGQAVRVIRKRPRETFAAQVAFVSPEVRTLRENAGLLSGQPMRGQRVVLHFTQAADRLIAGEEVLVRPTGFFGGSNL